MAGFDVIIKDGMIVDGTMFPRYRGDVGIKDGKVAEIGTLKGATAKKTLDATGLIVAPGFVDLHTHYDAQVFWDPYCTLSGWHGITSIAIGNCGFGFAPCRPEDRDRAMLTMTRNEAIPYDAMKAGMPWDWVSFPQFMDSLDKTPKGVNLLSYVPLTPVYGWVMGIESAKARRPTEREIAEMCRVVAEGIDAGACGWSAQVAGKKSVQRDYDGTPMITDLMTQKEVLAFAEMMGQRGGGVISLSGATEEGDAGLSPEDRKRRFYEEVARVGKSSLLYQTVVPNENSPETFRRTVAWLEECSRKGLRICGQAANYRGAFIYTFREEWNLYDDSPVWVETTVGTPEQRRVKMQDPETRRRLKAEYDSGYVAGLAGGFSGNIDGLVVENVKDPALRRYKGMTVKQIATEQNKHVIDAQLDLALADNLDTTFRHNRTPRNNPKYTGEVLHSLCVVPGLSDGGAHVKFFTGGAFPTETLAWLVRDEKVLGLEEAHHRLSYRPAIYGGFRDRGYLREGAWADVVVYDMDKLGLGPAEIVHDFPSDEWRRVHRGQGYRWILVNGRVTQEDGQPTGAMAGKFLRHGRG